MLEKIIELLKGEKGASETAPKKGTHHVKMKYINLSVGTYGYALFNDAELWGKVVDNCPTVGKVFHGASYCGGPGYYSVSHSNPNLRKMMSEIDRYYHNSLARVGIICEKQIINGLRRATHIAMSKKKDIYVSCQVADNSFHKV